MEHGFLSQKSSGREGRGVKEKELNRNKKHTASGIGVSTDSEDTMNDDTPIGVASVVREGVTPSVVDMTVEMGKKNSLDDTTVPGSFPPLSTPVTTTAGNAPGKSSYANITGKPSGKKVNVRTLYTPGGNGIDVVVPVDSIRAISERFANTSYGFFLGKKVAYPIVANYVRNTWGKYGLVRLMFSSSTRLFSFQFNSMNGLDAMLENGPWFIRNNPLILKKWHLDENLLKEDVSTVPIWVKLHGVPTTAFSEDGLSVIATKLGTPLMLDSYTSDMYMQSWGRSSYARVMIELRADVELKDNIFVAMPKITRDSHYICNVRVEYERKPPRYSSCVPVGPKIWFKPQKAYRPVPKKPNASSSGNKKKGVEPTIEVSNSNSFDVLNSVDNDVEFGTNRGTTNLVNNGANSSGSSFMNIDNSSTGTTPIIDKIGKFEELLTSGKATLVDETGNPLKKVEFSGDYDSEDEVASVDNDMARSMAEWDSYPDNDDYEPYDDDMYENHDLSSTCNIIRDLKQQRDKLDLAVVEYKRQKEEYQKTQTILNQKQRDKEEKYLNDILQLQAKTKDLENVVCKMGKSTETLRLLTNEQKAFRDNLRKSGLGYNGPYVLSQAYAKIPKLYRAYELCDKNEQLHVFDSDETLEDAEKVD
ncbi:cytokinin dehydrogenase 3-like protein [Tanacetum coccineum]